MSARDSRGSRGSRERDSRGSRGSREINNYVGSPPPPNSRVVPYEGGLPNDRSRAQQRTRRSSRDEQRRSLVRLRQQGETITDVEMRDELPPVPSKDRKCTDLLFLVLFCFYWVAMFAIAGVSVQSGNPFRLIYGADYQGNICGDKSGPKASSKYVVYPRADQDIDQIAILQDFTVDFDVLDLEFFTVCRESCPQEGDLVCTYEAEAEIATIMSDSNKTREAIINGCLNNPFSIFFGPSFPCESEVILRGCWEMFFDTSPILFRCLPEYIYNVEVLNDESFCLTYKNYSLGSFKYSVCTKYQEVTKVTRVRPLNTNVLFDTFNSVSRVAENLYADVIKASDVILVCGVLVAVFIGLVYVGSLWYCVGTIVWFSILMCVLLLLAFTLFCYIRAGILDSTVLSRTAAAVDEFVTGVGSLLELVDVGDGDDFNSTIISSSEVPIIIGVSLQYKEEFRIAAYVLSVITLIILVLILSMASRISKAITIFAEASRAVRANVFLIFVPPFAVAALLAIICYWVVITAYVTTSGSIQNATLPEIFESLNLTDFNFQAKAFGQIPYAWVLNVYLFFGAIWSASFVSGVSHMIMSHVVAKWYWSGSPSDYRSAGSWAICSSIKVVFTNHLGSVAFGSLLISFIQLVRYISAFIQHRFNKLQTKNRVVKYLFMSLNCCLKCAEMCVKFISKHAYVMTGMYGTAFCSSTKMVFSALSHNLAQIATVTFLGDIILRFGQIVVVVLSGLITWMYLDSTPAYKIGGDLQLSSFVFPVVLTMILAWFVSYEILNVYDVAVDTILLSYCQDKKLLKLRAATHRTKYQRHLEEFIEKNKPGAPLATQNSLSVLA